MALGTPLDVTLVGVETTSHKQTTRVTIVMMARFSNGIEPVGVALSDGK